MSADLFAEFGGGSASARPQRGSHQQQSTSLIPDLDAFEDALSTRPPHAPNNIATQPSQAGTGWGQSAFESSSASALSRYGDSNGVLFDATLESAPDDESDDWGEFETAEIPTVQRSPNPPSNPQATVKRHNVGTPAPSKRSPAERPPANLMDMLSLDDEVSSSKSKPTATPAQKPPNPRRKVVPKITSPPPTQDDLFEEWGDFVDGPLTESSQTTASRSTKSIAATQRPRQVERRTPSEGTVTAAPSSAFQTVSTPTTADQVRPTNIPPPSVLLELFPQLLDELRQEATKARKDMQQKEQIEITANLIICTLKAAARVVAGRTLRWKRDSILSQSMRIGPARSGKSGGMKLNSVNKNEDIKEQQEAVDVLTMWRDRTALFNSIIQATGRRPIQVIPENARVMTVTANQGAQKATHACALCGLRRDERLPKIDENVEDSFGEWWTDHWGHTDCRLFWEKNQSLLGQR
ncbi:hypothetical protein BO71DRAFT_397865 [Aspergillus ellipticus CBS 707.79]|uniref:Serine/threonine-protein kinase ppk6 n=1 Tax=Aspergillus ellipticus CBS 707.79 TaxID=1448320 RepID=A0A319DDN4_9EURO|nr:hypothetical protein BO71DRAFT_397865 [Aspergillus ellipticus CBS 707.79]